MADVHVSYRLSEVRQAHPTVGLLFNITVALGQKPSHVDTASEFLSRVHTATTRRMTTRGAIL